MDPQTASASSQRSKGPGKSPKPDWATRGSSGNGDRRALRHSENHPTKENAPELDYRSSYVTTGGNTGCVVEQDLALLTKVRTLIPDEIRLLTVLYFPFRRRIPIWSGLTYRGPRHVEKLAGTPRHLELLPRQERHLRQRRELLPGPDRDLC
jgi:hypothetical protein